MKLIDANAVMLILSNSSSPDTVGIISQIANKVSKLPDKQKRGEWTANAAMAPTKFHCSCCNTYTSFGKLAHCPHCGAEMSNPE